jgi:RNA polymerase sigma-70 factor (ECF subfamily)
MTAYESLPEPEPQDPITYTGLMELLDMALGRLPHIQRTVVLLRDYEGYSYEEIGRITGLNESQVKVYIFRARMFLKNFIGKPEQVI